MTTRRFVIALLVVCSGGCSSPKYVPSHADLVRSEHGALIRVFGHHANIEGELIAADLDKVTVLPFRGPCITVPTSAMSGFVVRYARARHYGWTIPIGLLLPYIHGAFSIYTLPLHLIGTIPVTVAGEKSYRLTEKELSPDKLHLFARFPQGLPENVPLSRLRGEGHKTRTEENIKVRQE
jgi:hypothetical protein